MIEVAPCWSIFFATLDSACDMSRMSAISCLICGTVSFEKD